MAPLVLDYWPPPFLLQAVEQPCCDILFQCVPVYRTWNRSFLQNDTGQTCGYYHHSDKTGLALCGFPPVAAGALGWLLAALPHLFLWSMWWHLAFLSRSSWQPLEPAMSPVLCRTLVSFRTIVCAEWRLGWCYKPVDREASRWAFQLGSCIFALAHVELIHKWQQTRHLSWICMLVWNRNCWRISDGWGS